MTVSRSEAVTQSKGPYKLTRSVPRGHLSYNNQFWMASDDLPKNFPDTKANELFVKCVAKELTSTPKSSATENYSLVILSAVTVSRSEAVTQSKDPYPLRAASSYAAATRSTVLSSKCFPKICIPMGSLSFVSPHGTEIPGIPAMFAVTV